MKTDSNHQNNSAAITTLIPAHNEAGRIGGVLEVLRQVEGLSYILVIDDGSTDTTAGEVRRAAAVDGRIRLLIHPVNRGKGQAIYTGWSASQSPYLLLLDADLSNLQPCQVQALIDPVLKGAADMTLGLFSGGHCNTDLAHRLTPWLSGQRGLRSEMLKQISWRAAAGYGFETALTLAARWHGWQVQPVKLTGVWHPPSEHHRGVVRGFLNRLRMYMQIVHAWQVARSEMKSPQDGRVRSDRPDAPILL